MPKPKARASFRRRENMPALAHGPGTDGALASNRAARCTHAKTGPAENGHDPRTVARRASCFLPTSLDRRGLVPRRSFAHYTVGSHNAGSSTSHCFVS